MWVCDILDFGLDLGSAPSLPDDELSSGGIDASSILDTKSRPVPVATHQHFPPFIIREREIRTDPAPTLLMRRSLTKFSIPCMLSDVGA
jgi:hypothetical protein